MVYQFSRFYNTSLATNLKHPLKVLEYELVFKIENYRTSHVQAAILLESRNNAIKWDSHLPPLKQI